MIKHVLCACGRAVWVAIILIAIVAGARAQQQQFDSWLVLAVDVSGSVNYGEYVLQRDGYVAVLLDYKVAAALDRTGVAIVEFASTARVAVPWTDVRGAGAAYRNTERPFAGNTCIACGIELALELLDGKSGKRVIDISGDGVENVRCGIAPSLADLRDLAAQSEIQINTLSIVIDPVDRGTCSTGLRPATGRSRGAGDGGLARWYTALATGFSMSIVGLDDLQSALYRKLFAEISGYFPAEPAELANLGRDGMNLCRHGS